MTHEEQQIYQNGYDKGSINALEELDWYLFDKLCKDEIEYCQIMYEIKLYIDRLKEQKNV